MECFRDTAVFTTVNVSNESKSELNKPSSGLTCSSSNTYFGVLAFSQFLQVFRLSPIFPALMNILHSKSWLLLTRVKYGQFTGRMRTEHGRRSLPTWYCIRQESMSPKIWRSALRFDCCSHVQSKHYWRYPSDSGVVLYSWSSSARILELWWPWNDLEDSNFWKFKHCWTPNEFSWFSNDSYPQLVPDSSTRALDPSEHKEYFPSNFTKTSDLAIFPLIHHAKELWATKVMDDINTWLHLQHLTHENRTFMHKYNYSLLAEIAPLCFVPIWHN